MLIDAFIDPSRYLAFQSVHNPYEDPTDSGVPGTDVVRIVDRCSHVRFLTVTDLVLMQDVLGV